MINRPLSHDLMKNIFTVFQINLKEVLIDNLQDGIFYSKLVCEKDGQEVEVDSRTSDALALAVRFNCPIFTYEFILESAGAIINEPENKEGSDEEDEENESVETLSTSISPQSDLSKLTIKELNEKLGELLDKEDYEAAARIRDELDRRKNNILNISLSKQLVTCNLFC